MEIFGYPVHTCRLDEALRLMAETLNAERNLHVVTLNPEMLMHAEKDPELAQILKTAGLVIPDGAGVVWALRKAGYENATRLPGIELSEAVLKEAASERWRVAIIGAKEETLQLATETLTRCYSGLNIVYDHHGYFTAQEEADIARACAQSNPDIVFVALGVPRQEKWIARYSHFFTSTVFIGIGGSLDVWSGQKKRAPRIFRLLNLEWLYRISSEPWRIKRISRTLPAFVVKVLTKNG